MEVREKSGTASRWAEVGSHEPLEVSTIVTGLPFLVILFLGIVNTIASTSLREEFYGTTVYPVTYLMIEGIQGAYLIFALLVLTLYSGETAWRERSMNLDGVLDSLPVPTGVFWSAKLTALLSALFVLLTPAGLATVSMQLWHGYHRIEPALYLEALYLEIGIPLALIVVLALFLQGLTGNKYSGSYSWFSITSASLRCRRCTSSIIC